MNKQDKIRIAQETLNISATGTYLLANRIYSIPKTEDTVLLNEEQHAQIGSNIAYDMKRKATVEVVRESTLTGIYRLARTLKSGEDAKFIGVLNFASAKNPGGGFLNGSMAQEESLAYSSNLYCKLLSGNGEEFYNYHKRNRLPFYSDLMLVTPVTFFRDSQFKLVANPVTVTVITSPAVNVNVARGYKKTDQEIYHVMQVRMQKILGAFTSIGCKYIILGAFGCGVFKNNVHDVAEIWANLLYNDGFEHCFDRVTFSILDKSGNGSLDVFSNMLLRH